jgi:hypothetical protein
MHIKKLYLEDGFLCKKVSGELHGQCPSCGHPRHFIVRKEGKKGDRQVPEMGSFFCRNCDISGKSAGNAITYLMKVRDLSFLEACDYVGYEPPQNPDYNQGARRSAEGGASQTEKKSDEVKTEHQPNFIWYPQETEFPEFVQDQKLWQEHALKFVDFCHEQILQRPRSLEWFAARGVPLEMVKKMKLGFNPGQKSKKNGKEYQNSYRIARAWGMPALPARDDGSIPDKIVLPAGLVIPCWSGPDGTGEVVRVQIRKMDDSKWVVKGSCGYSKAHMIFNPGMAVSLIVENERDGMAVSVACPEITVIPVATAKGKPCKADHDELRNKKLILLALDPDKTNKTNQRKWERDFPGRECPVYAFGTGVEAVDWWYQYHDQAYPWVIQGFGDIGEAILAGEDVGAWVRQGIEYYLGAGKKPVEPEPEAKLHVFCRLLHQHGLHWQWAEDMHDWSWGPEPVGSAMYDVPSGHIGDLMYDNEVWPALQVCGRVDSRPWTGKRIFDFFKEEV